MATATSGPVDATARPLQRTRTPCPATSALTPSCEVALWRCDPLSAFITVETCQQLQDRATKAARSRALRASNLSGERMLDAVITLSHLAPCVDCPGILTLAKRAGSDRPVKTVPRRRVPVAAAPTAAAPHSSPSPLPSGARLGLPIAAPWAKRYRVSSPQR